MANKTTRVCKCYFEGCEVEWVVTQKNGAKKYCKAHKCEILREQKRRHNRDHRRRKREGIRVVGRARTFGIHKPLVRENFKAAYNASNLMNLPPEKLTEVVNRIASGELIFTGV